MKAENRPQRLSYILTTLIPSASAWLTAGLIGLVACPTVSAQVLTGTRLDLEGVGPAVVFKDTTAPTYEWSLAGNEGGFVLVDLSATKYPFFIRAAAATDSLVVDTDGDVGFGINSPVKKLHAVSGDTPTLRLEQIVTAAIRGHSAEALSPQIWDVGGNELGFFVEDGTNNTSPFTIEPAAPNGSLFVATNGSVGNGTEFPNNIGGVALPGRVFNVRTDAAGTAGVARFVTQGAGGAQFHLVHNNGPTNQKILRIQNASGITSFSFVKDNLTENLVTGAIVIKNLNGNVGLKVSNPVHPLQLAGGAHCLNGTTWTNACSRELKQDITPITSDQAREAVRSLAPVSYRYKSDTSEQFVGFIAEDVPELVATGDRKGLAAMDVVGVLTKVVQDQDRELTAERIKNAEQQKLITRQQEELAALKTTLNERLARIEQRLGAQNDSPADAN